jgi:hypothetical protein
MMSEGSMTSEGIMPSEGIIPSEGTMTSEHNGTSWSHFGGALQADPFKSASMAFAVTATPVSLLGLYSIIWFERFGSDQGPILRNSISSKKLSDNFFPKMKIYKLQKTYI